MSFAGNLKTVSFGDVLQLISTGKKTGALNLERPRRGKKIFFREGEIIASASSPPTDEERLGQLLLRRGQISPEDLERALKRQHATGRRLGQVFVDLSAIDRQALADVLAVQVEEVVYSVFGWPDGDFHFTEGEAPDKAHTLVQLNTLNVMMEGARRYDEYAQIAHTLPDDEAVLRMAPAPQLPDGEIALSEEDLEVLCAIDGERTVGDILSTSSRGEYAASKALHKLLSAKVAEPCPRKANAARQRDEEKDIFDLVFKLYSHSLDAVHKALIDQFGDAGDRVFFRIPSACDKDPWELVEALVDAPGQEAMDHFRTRTERIPSPVRLHRVLATARHALETAVESMVDRLGPRHAQSVAAGIEKDLSILLAQKRVLADKYELKREFLQALKGQTQ
ncbi:MAG TPA: DUF4388 domain-containing protein [Acidobacteriota bacterium]|nr:DUF4388 domain-containing protein [Acidobacteriota bacterium]